MLQLSDELDALLAAEDLDAQIAAFGALNQAVNAIGNDELTALIVDVALQGATGELAGAFAQLKMIVWILTQAAEASQ